jgi:hypothetical protein
VLCHFNPLDGADAFTGALKMRVPPPQGDKKMQSFRFAEKVIPACGTLYSAQRNQ